MVHGRHPDEGSFSSSDPTLDAVFGLLRDSALYGVQEQFVDTPTREKGQFLADAVNISYATMALFGEHAYTAQALREFGWSAGPLLDRPARTAAATTRSTPTATGSGTSPIFRS